MLNAQLCAVSNCKASRQLHRYHSCLGDVHRLIVLNYLCIFTIVAQFNVISRSSSRSYNTVLRSDLQRQRLGCLVIRGRLNLQRGLNVQLLIIALYSSCLFNQSLCSIFIDILNDIARFRAEGRCGNRLSCIFNLLLIFLGNGATYRNFRVCNIRLDLNIAGVGLCNYLVAVTGYITGSGNVAACNISARVGGEVSALNCERIAFVRRNFKLTTNFAIAFNSKFYRSISASCAINIKCYISIRIFRNNSTILNRYCTIAVACNISVRSPTLCQIRAVNRHIIKGQIAIVLNQKLQVRIMHFSNIKRAVFQRDIRGSINSTFPFKVETLCFIRFRTNSRFINRIGVLIKIDSKAFRRNLIVALQILSRILICADTTANRVFQQRNGITVLRCCNSVSQRLIIGIANLSYCNVLQRLNRVGIVCILLGSIICVAIRGNIRGECTAGNACCASIRRTIMVFNHFLRAIARKCAIINDQLAYCSVRTICSGKQNRICAILNRKSAIINGSLIPVHDNVLGSIAKRTTINRQDTTLIIFNGVNTTAKITIINSKVRRIIAILIATVTNCARKTTVIFNRSIINGHRSTLIIKDGITAITARAIWA